MAAATTAFLPSIPRPSPRLAAAVRRPPPVFTGATDAVMPPEDEDSSDDDNTDAAPRRSGRKDRHRAVRIAWEKLVRWSRSWRRRNRSDVLDHAQGGGSRGRVVRESGRPWRAHVAAKKADLQVAMLLRDDLVCRSINNTYVNGFLNSAASFLNPCDSLLFFRSGMYIGT